MRSSGRIVGFVALTLLAFAFVVAFGLVASSDAAAALLLVLGGTAVVSLVGIVAPGSGGASQFEAALRPPPRQPRRPPELSRIELDLALAEQHESHLRTRVVPLVREIVSTRVVARAEPPPPEVDDLFADPTLDTLRAAVDALESQ